MTDDKLLRIYLNDHLAGVVGATRLAGRSRSNNRDSPLGEYLSELEVALNEDSAVIHDVLRALDARPSIAKTGLALLGEGVGRLKLNGRLTGYSDLSRVLEVELLCLDAVYRQLMWAVLTSITEEDARLQGFDFVRLEERARTHQARLLALSGDAAAVAFSRQPWPPHA